MVPRDRGMLIEFNVLLWQAQLEHTTPFLGEKKEKDRDVLTSVPHWEQDER